MELIKNSFVYERFTDELSPRPLRLIRLCPSASFSEGIECELFITSLDTKEDFEALSYTWGDPKNTVPITLHGQNYQVTKNLDSALRHLRLKDRQRTLWVDSLCINQADVDETNQQVRQMQGIYAKSGARRVVVWLGSVPKADIALAFCAEVKRRRDAEEARLLDFENQEAPAACESLFIDPPW